MLESDTTTLGGGATALDNCTTVDRSWSDRYNKNKNKLIGFPVSPIGIQYIILHISQYKVIWLCMRCSPLEDSVERSHAF